MPETVPSIYPLLGMLAGHVLVLLFNPIRLALRAGFRCITRFKRIWLTFVLLGFAYSVFNFTTFQQTSGVDFTQLQTIGSWNWPRLGDVWRETPLPALEGVAGIFDNATTTHPLPLIGAVLRR